MKPKVRVGIRALLGNAFYAVLLAGCREALPPEAESRAATAPSVAAYVEKSGPFGTIAALAFNGQSNQLLSGSAPFMPGVQAYPIRRWAVNGISEVALLEGHRKAVLSLDVSADSRFLVSASSDRTVRVWDLTSNRELVKLRGHSDELDIAYSISAQFSPSGSTVISAGGEGDGTVIVWDWQHASAVKRIQCPGWIECMSLSQDGRHLAIGGWKGPASRKRPFLGLCDLETGIFEREFQTTDEGDFISSIALLGENHVIVVGDRRGHLGWFSVEDGQLLRSLPAHGKSIEAVLPVDKARFITAGAEGRISCWTTTTGDQIWSHDMQQPIASAAMCPKKELIAVGGRQGSIRIWRLEDMEQSDVRSPSTLGS